MLTVERLNIVAIAGASLGVLCGAGLVPVSGPLGWLSLVLFATCLVGAVGSQRSRVRNDRALLAELQEHQAALGSPASPHLTIASAALELVDIAERAIAESAAQVAELKTQVERLRASRAQIAGEAGPQDFKNAFVTKVSHELRTPLAGIKAYVELLIDGEVQDEQTRQEFYRVIYGEADRLGRLIEDIVAISRIEAGVGRPHTSATNVSKLADAALNRVDANLRQKDVTVSRIEPCTGYQTFGDPAMLERALVTLLINAVKFSPTGGGINLEIGTDPQEKTVLIRILDQGPGVEPQDVPGLFDKFDGAGTCARTTGGAGIALALVRQIIETVHGGSVLVESPREGGCCFGLRLPLYAPEAERIADKMCIR